MTPPSSGKLCICLSIIKKIGERRIDSLFNKFDRLIHFSHYDTGFSLFTSWHRIFPAIATGICYARVHETNQRYGSGATYHPGMDGHAPICRERNHENPYLLGS